MKIQKITQLYTKQYSDPIRLNIGDQVVLGKEETIEKWKGWIWAVTEDKSNSGWIPIQIITFSADKKSGIIIDNYSAQELSVKVGDYVEMIKSLNGWCWVKNTVTNEEGWIPSECIEF